MMVNNGVWLVFWVLYFHQFPVVRGWERMDVIMLWAVLATAYGAATALFGNVMQLAPAIMEGRLDVYLTYPKNVLLQALTARMAPMAWGDVLFGVLVFVWLGQPTWGRAALFATCSLLVALFFTAFAVAAHSLAFYLGGAATIARNLVGALIHFSSFPSGIFDGFSRLILFTLIPAGFLHTVPVAVMRDFDPRFFAAWIAATAVLAVGAWRLFHAGLRRYESGNLMHLQG